MNSTYSFLSLFSPSPHILRLELYFFIYSLLSLTHSLALIPHLLFSAVDFISSSILFSPSPPIPRHGLYLLISYSRLSLTSIPHLLFSVMDSVTTFGAAPSNIGPALALALFPKSSLVLRGEG